MPSVARFKELDSTATPAPWYTDTDPDLGRTEDGDLAWPEHLEEMPPHWDYYLTAVDAEFIVKLRNGFPHFIAVADAARQLLNSWNTDSQSVARARLNTALQRLEDV